MKFGQDQIHVFIILIDHVWWVLDKFDISPLEKILFAAVIVGDRLTRLALGVTWRPT
jgi:hypothetical protein